MELKEDTQEPMHANLFFKRYSGNLSQGLQNTPLATVRVATAESYTGVSVNIEQRKKTSLELYML